MKGTTVVLFVALLIPAQETGKIEGQVFRSDKKEPYVGLVVKLTKSSEAGDEEKAMTAIVDEKGNYVFSGRRGHKTARLFRCSWTTLK